MTLEPNSLYYGDCLDVMREWPAESVDLCYLDPPFKSDQDYNILFGNANGGGEAQLLAFEDTWSWDDAAIERVRAIGKARGHAAHGVISGLHTILGDCGMMAYLSYMAERLTEVKRVLRRTASIYLHCDPHASHYLKAVMDSVFGSRHFMSEVIWRRTGSHNKCDRWAPIHDVLLFYTVSNDFIWNNPKQRYMKGHVAEHFKETPQGYRTDYYGNVLTGSGLRGGLSGKPWRGIDPSSKGRHWAIPGKLWEESGLDETGLNQHEKLDALFEAGYVRIEEGTFWPMYERAVRDDDGPASPDIWSYQPYTEGTVFRSENAIDTDVEWLKPRSAERLGYPTQKPLGLLDRVIRSSSNEGAVVLDPFCGCGTTVESAYRLRRKFLGIDISPFAIELVRKRRLRDRSVPIHGIPVEMDGARLLAKEKPFEFEKWAVTRIPGLAPNNRQVGDKGIDGRGEMVDGGLVLAQVKGGKFSLSQFRDFLHVMDREDAAIGIYLTLDPVTSRAAKSEAAAKGHFELGISRYQRVQLWSIAEHFDDRRPAMPPLSDPYTGKAMQSDLFG